MTPCDSHAAEQGRGSRDWRAAAWLERLLAIVLAAVVAWFPLVYCAVAVARTGYPYELEWMEGGSLQQLHRVLDGLPLYVPPTPDFVPFIYTPLYYYVSALVALAIGPGFVALRLVSFVASLGSLTLIVLLVRQETGNARAAVLAGCLFAAMFPSSDGWYDLARTDSLSLGLFLGGVYSARIGKGTLSALAAAVLLCLAYLTKQSVLPAVPFLFLGVAALNRRRALWLGGLWALFTGVAILLLDWLHEGWFTYYTLIVPAGHPFEHGTSGTFLRNDLLEPLGIAIALGLLGLFAQWRAGLVQRAIFWSFLCGGVLLAVWLSRTHSGGHVNVVVPAYALVAVLAGMGIDAGLRLAGKDGGPRGAVMRALVLVLCLIQFAQLTYDPWAWIPTRTDRETGDRLVERIRRIEGDVYIPFHGYLARYAAKTPFAHAGAVADVLRGPENAARESLDKAITDLVAGQRFAAIIQERAEFPWNLEIYYKQRETLLQREDGFYCISGMRRRPALLYLPWERDEASTE